MRSPRPLVLALVAGASLLRPCPTLAQEEPPLPVEAPAPRPDSQERTRQILELQEKAFEAIRERDWAEAERLMLENLRLEPGNFVILYNLACMRSRQGDAEGGIDYLKKAIEAGFVDIHRLRTDPDLGGLRDHGTYAVIVEGWPRILGAHLEANLKHAGRIFDGRTGAYATTREEKMRVAIMSAMDPVSTDAAREDLARLYEWGLANVFPDLAEEGKAEHDPWAVVVLPTQRDFRKWALATYGADAIAGLSGIGGHYDHDQKRLVAMDLGATLRHEFFHVLHWRSCTRLGQMHPIWIQEGLCSLVEDYELGSPPSAASLRPVASWRSNMVKRLASGGRLPTLKQLTSMPRGRFTEVNPLANYGLARTFFLYLHDQGKLKDWYAHYTTHYREDPSGLKSIEAVLGKASTEIDRDYRAWVRKLPEVAEQTRPGNVGIGADVETGDGDGPVIVAIPRVRGRASPAQTAGLRVRDVITAVNSQPTRDLHELVRVLGQFKAGDEVEVAYRRGKVHSTTRVVLERR
ncbi:MAG: PDZ domain-containing protein [Phycisphaerales bacterium]